MASRFLSEGEVFGAVRELAKIDFWIELDPELSLPSELIRSIDLRPAEIDDFRRTARRRIARARQLLEASGTLVEEEYFLILTIAMEIALVLRSRGHLAGSEVLAESELLRSELDAMLLEPSARFKILSVARAISRNSGIELHELLRLPQ